MFSEELEKISWEETTEAIYSKTESDVLRALGTLWHWFHLLPKNTWNQWHT